MPKTKKIVTALCLIGIGAGALWGTQFIMHKTSSPEFCVSCHSMSQPKEKPLCKNGCPNVLTRDEGTSKLAQGNSPNTCIVQVEKFVGQAPEVTVFKQPKHAA